MILDYPLMKHETANVVYVPTPKVASTYFKKHLTANGFISIEKDQIDLTSSTLFSHIMDPVLRRNKGVAEFFNFAINLPNESLLEIAHVYNGLLQILQAPYFDVHSAPLHVLYDGFIDQIHFIPIDVECIDHLQMTSDFLRQHGLDIQFPSEKIHQSELSKIEIFHVVEEHLKSASRHSDLFRATFAQDIILYQRILDRLNVK